MRFAGAFVTGSVFLQFFISGCDSASLPHLAGGQWTMSDSTAHMRILANEDDRCIIVLGPGGIGDTIGTYHTSQDAEFLPFAPAGLHFQVPLRRVAVTSTTHLPFLVELGHADAVVAAMHLDQVRDSILRVRIAKGEVSDITTGDGIDRERLLALEPDAVFAYPFGRNEGDALARSGIPVIEICEYLEQDPLERAEWLKVFGVLLGEERRADSLFAGISARYEAVKAGVHLSPSPRVFFGSVWQGQWWVPGGDSYMARMIADAGGDYLFKHRGGSENLAVDMETILSLADSIDRWGVVLAKEGSVERSDMIGRDDRLLRVKAIDDSGSAMFVANTTADDLFGKAVIEPDMVLRDLVDGMDPVGAMNRGWRSVYFRRITPKVPDIVH